MSEELAKFIAKYVERAKQNGWVITGKVILNAVQDYEDGMRL